MDRDPASPAPALTECRPAWLGLTPLVMNPTFTNVDDLDKLAQGADGVEWTHWADLVNIYGTDETGFARVPWDNVGVQYGLEALTSGRHHPRGVPRPQRPDRQLEGLERDGDRGLPVRGGLLAAKPSTRGARGR